jgi:cell wall-associated NlpC family hydrolase
MRKKAGKYGGIAYRFAAAAAAALFAVLSPINVLADEESAFDGTSAFDGESAFTDESAFSGDESAFDEENTAFEKHEGGVLYNDESNADADNTAKRPASVQNKTATLQIVFPGARVEAGEEENTDGSSLQETGQGEDGTASPDGADFVSTAAAPQAAESGEVTLAETDSNAESGNVTSAEADVDTENGEEVPVEADGNAPSVDAAAAEADGDIQSEGIRYAVYDAGNLIAPVATAEVDPENGLSGVLTLPAGCYYVQREDGEPMQEDRTLSSMEESGETIQRLTLPPGAQIRLVVENPSTSEETDSTASDTTVPESADVQTADAYSGQTASASSGSSLTTGNAAGFSSPLEAQLLTSLLLGGGDSSFLTLLAGLYLDQNEQEAGYRYDSMGQNNTAGDGYDASGWTPAPFAGRDGMSSEQFSKLYNKAHEAIGAPYVWGGTSPDTGFDCSGFVCWALNNSGNGWNVGRLTAEGLRERCQILDESQAQPGDLVFFENTYSTPGASHVGIYLGDGKMIHAGNPVQITNLHTTYWESHGMQFGRLF